MSIRETMIPKIPTAGGRLRVRSALNSILWLCSLVVGSFMFIITQTDDPFILFPWLGIVIVSVVTALIGFYHFLFSDPDKLQSEGYQIQKLELMREKGEASLGDLASTEKVSNPHLPEHQESIKGDSDP